MENNRAKGSHEMKNSRDPGVTFCSAGGLVSATHSPELLQDVDYRDSGSAMDIHVGLECLR